MEYKQQFKQTFSNIINNKLSILNKYTIWIGIINGESKLEREDKQQKKKLNNAQILNALSNGWDIEKSDGTITHVPSRPILDIAIKEAKKELIPNFYRVCINGILTKKWTERDILKQMHILGDRVSSLAKEIIYKNDGTLVSNAPSTIAQKGFNHPLFNTSQLAKAITYYIEEN